MEQDRRLRIGVLAFQGGVAEHEAMLARLGLDASEVRLPEHLAGLDGIILPGGESTTIGKMLVHYEMLAPLQLLLREGLPAYGTCAGMILLARDRGESRQPGLDVMDIRVRRNAFGSQLDSFEEDLQIPALGEPAFHAVFIRAPLIEQIGPAAECVAALPDGTPVAARQGHLLASAFHPELGVDARVHALFIQMCRSAALARRESV